MALEAVWPRPQIEASRMTCPTSIENFISPASPTAAAGAAEEAPPGARCRRGRERTGRRTRHGRKRRCAAGSCASPRCHRTASHGRSQGRSHGSRAFEGQRNVEFSGPRMLRPRRRAIPPATPAAGDAAAEIDELLRVEPKGTSYTPGLPTWPERQKSFGPVDRSSQSRQNVCLLARSKATLIRVSTLLNQR